MENGKFYNKIYVWHLSLPVVDSFKKAFADYKQKIPAKIAIPS